MQLNVCTIVYYSDKNVLTRAFVLKMDRALSKEYSEEIYAAFDTKKLQIVEARNKRATALMNAADRILKGIRSRVSNFATVEEINSYFAS